MGLVAQWASRHWDVGTCLTVVGLVQRQAPMNCGMHLSYISGAITVVVHELLECTCPRVLGIVQQQAFLNCGMW